MTEQEQQHVGAIDLGSTDFDAVYRGEGIADVPFEKPPWDIAGPQPQVVRLDDEGAFRGRVLDAGCGAGDNAIFLAGRGHDVTGVDGSPTAIEIARGRAAEQGADVTFAVADATRLDGFGQEFDTVLDSALFHCLPEEARAPYAAALHRVTRAGAHLHLLCFADVPDSPLPFAVSRDELRATFGQDWDIADIDLVRYTGAFGPEDAARIAGSTEGLVDVDKIQTDADGHVLIPMWYLRAQRT